MSDKLPGEKYSVVSATDEAFALAAFENYRQVWITKWKSAKYGTTEPFCQALYTRTGRKKENEMFKAWTDEGMVRWKELQAHVVKDRETDEKLNHEAEKRMLGRVVAAARLEASRGG